MVAGLPYSQVKMVFAFLLLADIRAAFITVF